MSTPIIKIKVLPKPVIKGKMDVRFPSRVFGQAFIKVEKANGNFTIFPDASDLDPGPVSSSSTARVLLYDYTVGVWRAVSVESLLVSGLDLDLQAIAALSGTGILARNADNSWALRQLVAPAAGLTISDPAAVGGNPTFALANDLAAIEALTGTNTIYYRSGVDTWSPVTIGSLLSWSGGTINVGDPELVALAGLVSAADQLPYFTGSGTAALTTFTAFARSLVDDSDAPTMRATLGSTAVGDAVFIAANAAAARSAIGAVIGTNVQAWDADLDTLAALSGTGIARRTGANTWSVGTAVANSELAAMANGTVKGNVSGSSASPSDITPSQIIDVIGSTRGSVLYRGASGWSQLAPGTNGQVLTTAGSGTDPSWQDSTGGGGGLSDTDRRNILLDRIYQSKALAAPRRVINAWADGFKSASGINAGASSNYTPDTANGRVFPDGAIDANTIVLYHFDANATTDSSGNSNTATATGSPAVSSTNAKFSNALQLSGSGQYLALSSASALNVGAGSFSFDLWMSPSSVSGTRNIFSQSASSSANGLQISSSKLSWHIDGVGDFAGTTTLVAGTLYHVEFSRSGSSNIIFLNGVAEISFTNSSSYDLRGGFIGHGNFNTDFAGSIDEFRFSNIARHTSAFTPPTVAYGTINNMTLTTVSQATDASVGNARALLEFDNSAPPTLNTDLTVEVTCDGGVNWAPATLSAFTAYSQGGRTVAETADTACTSGASFAVRIKTANAKSVPIYGVSVLVH
ncbi:MAG: hypothetical protein J0G95_10780 [Rhizobiales bacterium]|nr:hypothetical protein [Hyphomicrobiales bacterium]